MESLRRMNLEPRDDKPARGIATWRSQSRTAGFSFAELLVAISIAAFVLVIAVMAFQAIGLFSLGRSSLQTITFSDSGVMTNFYNTAGTKVSTWSTPTYGHLARVEELRDKYYEDVQKSIAVYCLPRVGRSSLRTNALTIPASYAIGTFDFRRLSTPELFRQFLADSLPSAGAGFSTNAYAIESGAVRGRNLSVLMLRKSSSRTSLNLHCMYEVDFVRPSSPGGIYASVRRYEGAVLTDYYDVFYPDVSDTTALNSDYFYVAAAFERSVRPSSSSSVANVASRQPFYFVWFPDPASPTLPSSSGSYTNGMIDQTSLLFVTPMFPSL
jgi:hypothetical protein